MQVELIVTGTKSTIEIQETEIKGIRSFTSQITVPDGPESQQKLLEYMFDFTFTPDDQSDLAAITSEHRDTLRILQNTELVPGRGYVVTCPFWVIQINPKHTA